MDAALIAQGAEDLVAGDFENHLLHPAERAWAGFERLDLEAVGLGEARVHAVEVGGEKRGLVAAGAGAEFHDGVAVLIRVGREQRVLHGGLGLGDALFERGDFRRGHLGHLGVVAARQLQVFGQLGAGLLQQRPAGDQLLEPGVFAQDLPRLPRIVVEIGGGNLSFEFAKAVGLASEEWGEVHGERER